MLPLALGYIVRTKECLENIFLNLMYGQHSFVV
jgi:hypothetical protein